ncbi:hypothetical protein [Mobiluncus mulieris]|uniref:C1q domain-containing protein n=1 Tax=Mobiluncus mulieris TaxID=2052 RepID=A0ABD4TWH2_9ACTO|nr:hypothetical protein [Mobiluncus mulieris]MCU9969230.1 hypothetical protein [Mobiluncus mulieris]
MNTSDNPSYEEYVVGSDDQDLLKMFLARDLAIVKYVLPGDYIGLRTREYLAADLLTALNLLYPEWETNVSGDENGVSFGNGNLHEFHTTSLKAINDGLSVLQRNIKNLIAVMEPENAHNKSSSSVDDENVQSQSTGEETPVTGESSGESGGETRCERCTNCGQPASRAQAALSAGDTPAVPRDPQPTTIPESQVA